MSRFNQITSLDLSDIYGYKSTVLCDHRSVQEPLADQRKEAKAGVLHPTASQANYFAL
jgi:hypothetical protein